MVFISYSSKEYELASRLRSILSDNNIDCWMAPESIPAGGDYSNEIPKAIANSDMFMVIVSENSQHSTYVPKELDTAIASKKIVIPIRIDSHKLENAFKFWLTNIQCIDAMNGLENACEQIVNRIRHAKQIPNASDISSDLPERISFYELLDVTDSREIDIQKMRDKADVTKALAVPIARNDQGGIVYLDMHHKGDGPNCMIIGPTGSGKSEFLETYMLSLALFYSADNVRFYVVDFKGGGLVNDLHGLPHLGRCLTELSDGAVGEFMAGFRSDLQNRKKMLDEYGVANIYQYLKKRMYDKAMPAMPHLFVMIDELAEFKREYPAEMKEIQLSATGANADVYGIHFICGTQYAHGIVDDSLASIITCQICSSKQQGIYISEPISSKKNIPGRLYFQSAAQDAVQLIQLAYCGSLVDPNLSNKEELKDYDWFFRKKSQRESLISALMRYELD